MRILLTLLFTALLILPSGATASSFVTVRGHEFHAGGKPYHFVGTNYWYGGLLGLEKDRKRGIERLRKELDFLRSQGVTNLRLMAGAEGRGPLNGVTRVGPPLQPEQGRFDEGVLDGLDLVLHEMGKRKMRAVIFFSNNWEWSGGFQQYLIWDRIIPDRWLKDKPDWDQLRDIVAQFYTCKPCVDSYTKQVELVLGRTNKLSKRRYVDDPVIMAWELANEPRPMRPAANDAYRKWIASTSALIKSGARRQLVTIGHEGWIGTQDIELFEEVHAGRDIDYLTIHIWPKNWGWLAEGYVKAESETVKYIDENTEVAKRLNKPLVIEEFGLPRDGGTFDAASPTTQRDKYFERVLSFVETVPVIAGANFWAFGGSARPIKGQTFWKPGDEYMGDPPMEEQGLNSVFDTDQTTWKVIKKKARSLSR